MSSLISFLSARKEGGLLVMRLGLGLMMMTHGWPKLIGGPDKWERLGGNMEHLGISLFPVFWGLMAALSEFAGGALVAIGFWSRTASCFLIFTMIVAALTHFSSGEGLSGASHAIEVGFAFFGILVLGPGKYSVNQK